MKDKFKGEICIKKDTCIRAAGEGKTGSKLAFVVIIFALFLVFSFIVISESGKFLS